MLQEIIVFVIISASVGYTIYSVVKSVRIKKSAPCGGCTGCDVKKEILKNLKNKQEAEAFQCGSFQKSEK